MSIIVYALLTDTIAISIIACLEGLESFYLWPLMLGPAYAMCALLQSLIKDEDAVRR